MATPKSDSFLLLLWLLSSTTLLESSLKVTLLISRSSTHLRTYRRPKQCRPMKGVNSSTELSLQNFGSQNTFYFILYNERKKRIYTNNVVIIANMYIWSGGGT